MQTTDSDAALVERVRTHDDRVAFELIVRRHQAPLRAFLRRLARNDAARADDLAQETFIKLYKSIATYRAQARFTTWLYRIAYNTFLNAQRRRIDELPFEDDQHAAAGDVTQSLHDKLDIEAGLQRLTQRQRAVFDLHYRKGMTHMEVATALELPLGTVKSDLARGIEELRNILIIPESR